jgi:hypothetical protein
MPLEATFVLSGSNVTQPDSDLIFIVTFSKAVSGVTADQFVVTNGQNIVLLEINQTGH